MPLSDGGGGDQQAIIPQVGCLVCFRWAVPDTKNHFCLFFTLLLK